MIKIKGYNEWCDWLTTRYDVMPHWYWSPALRMESYHGYRKNAENWNAEERASGAGGSPIPAEDDTGQDQAHPAPVEAQGNE